MRVGHSRGIHAQLHEQVVVTEAQQGERETGRLHHVPVIRAEPLDRRLERQGQQRIQKRLRHPVGPWFGLCSRAVKVFLWDH